MIDLGITGSQYGATNRQLERLRLFYWHSHIGTVNFGCCIGVDKQAYDLFLEIREQRKCWHTGDGPAGLEHSGWPHSDRISLYPPENNSKRAECPVHDRLDVPREYLERDRELAGASNVMLALPRSPRYYTRSGTWYTANFAASIGRLVLVILPDGSVDPFFSREDWQRRHR